MAPRLKGVELELGGRTFVCPPLSLGTLEVMQDRLEAFKVATSPTDRETVRTVVDAVHAALIRNYPELTREEVANLLDVVNMDRAMLAVMGVSLPPAEPGESAPVQASGSTGDGSSLTSSPAPAGPSSTSAST